MIKVTAQMFLTVKLSIWLKEISDQHEVLTFTWWFTNYLRFPKNKYTINRKLQSHPDKHSDL